MTDDPVINEIITQIIARSDQGMIKFGRSLEDADGDVHKWVDDAIEESLDCAVYLVKLRRVLKKMAYCNTLKSIVKCTCASCVRG